MGFFPDFFGFNLNGTPKIGRCKSGIFPEEPGEISGVGEPAERGNFRNVALGTIPQQMTRMGDAQGVDVFHQRSAGSGAEEIAEIIYLLMSNLGEVLSGSCILCGGGTKALFP